MESISDIFLINLKFKTKGMPLFVITTLDILENLNLFKEKLSLHFEKFSSQAESQNLDLDSSRSNRIKNFFFNNFSE